jgi:hypothetical protein
VFVRQLVQSSKPIESPGKTLQLAGDDKYSCESGTDDTLLDTAEVVKVVNVPILGSFATANKEQLKEMERIKENNLPRR